MREITLENFLKMNPQTPQYSEKNQHYSMAGVNPVYYLDDNTQGEQVAPLAASIDWSQLTPSVIDSYSETNEDVTTALFSGNVNYEGQSFLVGSANITLASAVFYIKKTDAGGFTGADTVAVKIYAMTGSYGTTSKPTGAALATSDTILASSLPTSLTLKSFKFTGGNRITLSANTHYVVILVFTGGDSSNFVSLGLDNSSPTHAGNASYSTDGSSWTTLSQDACFYVLGGGTLSGGIEGNIVHMIPSTVSNYSVYAITDTTKVYGISTSTIDDLGYISGSSQNNSGGYLGIAGNYLFATFSAGGAVYKMPIPSGSWTSFGAINTSSGVHILEPFLDFVALRDGSGSFTNGGLIKKIDVSAFTVSTGIDLGAGWGVSQMRNLNNKYLAIAGGRTAQGGTVQGYPQNYIFLWDGISSRYNNAVKVPGQFIDMKVVDSVLYVAVQVSATKTCMYYLSNLTLKKLFTPQISGVFNLAGVNAPIPCSLFDFKNSLGIHLSNTSDFSDPIMIYGKEEAGDLEFIHSYGKLFYQMTPGFDGNLFAAVYNTGGISIVYYLPSSGTYQQIKYKSQWIPVSGVKAIDIYHDSVPVSGTDAIQTTIDGKGENIITGTVTTALDNITPTNYLTIKRTRLDVKGFTGDEIRITLTTVNSTWKPIIRAIKIIQK